MHIKTKNGYIMLNNVTCINFSSDGTKVQFCFTRDDSILMESDDINDLAIVKQFLKKNCLQTRLKKEEKARIRNENQDKIMDVFYDFIKLGFTESPKFSRSFLKEVSHIQKTKDFDEAIKHLVDLEVLRMGSITTKTSRKPTTMYTLLI